MKNNHIQELIFIYNAQSGLGNALLDSAHKLISPGTYDCRLCDITFGLLGERRQWKIFREQTDLPMTFLHKDEFLSAYASKFSPKYTFPLVLAHSGQELEVFLDTNSLNQLQDADELISAIKSRI